MTDDNELPISNLTSPGPVRPTFKFMLAHPAHLIALGFGSGLSPKPPAPQARCGHGRPFWPCNRG